MLYDLSYAILSLTTLCIPIVFSWYYHRNCFSHSTSLTSPHWPWDGLRNCFLLTGFLSFLLDSLSWSLWSVTRQWALVKNSFHPQGTNLHYWAYSPSHWPQTCSLAFIACVFCLFFFFSLVFIFIYFYFLCCLIVICFYCILI